MPGKIKKLKETDLVGGVVSDDVYPVTSTRAVYDNNNVDLDTILTNLNTGGGGSGEVTVIKDLYDGAAPLSQDLIDKGWSKFIQEWYFPDIVYEPGYSYVPGSVMVDAKQIILYKVNNITEVAVQVGNFFEQEERGLLSILAYGDSRIVVNWRQLKVNILNNLRAEDGVGIHPNRFYNRLSDNAVTENKIRNMSVSTNKLQDSAVTSDKLGKFNVFKMNASDYHKQNYINGTIAELYINPAMLKWEGNVGLKGIACKPSDQYLLVQPTYNDPSTQGGWECRELISSWENGKVYPLTVYEQANSPFPPGTVVGYIVFDVISSFRGITSDTGIGSPLNMEYVTRLSNFPIIVADQVYKRYNP